MTIVVIGPGAIGLFVATRLALSGERVALLVRPRAAETLRSRQLTLDQNGTTYTVPDVQIISDASTWRGTQPDLAIVCVKGYDTPGVLPALDALDPKHVLTLQNGLGNEDVLAAYGGKERVISGVITTSAEVPDWGHVAVTKLGGIGLAPMTAGQPVDYWATVFRKTGLRIETYADWQAMKWSKVLLNMLGSASAAILDMPVEGVYADNRMIALERQAFLEALNVMTTRGLQPVNLPGYPARTLAVAMRWMPAVALYPLLRKVIAGGRGGKAPSLHLALQQGNRRSEGAQLYGAVAASGAEIGVATPANQALWGTLRAIAEGDVSWDAYRQNPDYLLAAVEQQQHVH